MLASIRPDSWNLPLLVHVLGAMLLTGATVAFVVAQLTSARAPEPERMRRFAFRTLLLAVLPDIRQRRRGVTVPDIECLGLGDALHHRPILGERDPRSDGENRGTHQNCGAQSNCE